MPDRSETPHESLALARRIRAECHEEIHSARASRIVTLALEAAERLEALARQAMAMETAIHELTKDAP